MIRRFVVPVLTGAGTAEAYSPYFSGKVCSISYVKDGTAPFSDGVDFTITVAGTGEGLWTEEDVNASATRYPRGATHSTAGVASLYASGGTAVLDKIAVDRDRVKIAIASGGTAKAGTFHIVVDD